MEECAQVTAEHFRKAVNIAGVDKSDVKSDAIVTQKPTQHGAAMNRMVGQIVPEAAQETREICSLLRLRAKPRKTNE